MQYKNILKGSVLVGVCALLIGCGGSDEGSADSGINIGVLATGVTVSKYANDDGYLRRGLTRSFTRDDEKEVVIDEVTHLMWQDDSASKETKLTWSDAIEYCNNLELGGYNDWRLPSIEELISITNKGRKNPAYFTVFKNVKYSNDYFYSYWSSTKALYNTGSSYKPTWAYVVYSNNGSENSINQIGLTYVRCVRNMK